jgi:anti-sigma28 factor (negative regulator of flagellin synthesis)
VDRVEISTEGRLLAAQLDAPRPGAETMAPERIEAIRERIATGVYDTPEVIESVARKMIERGDLGL